MIQNLIQLGPSLEKIPINIQFKTIANMYNEIYNEYYIPRLGIAKVITKKNN